MENEFTTILFHKNAKPISDFEIEETYQKLKNKKSIEISNLLLLYRFRVGVYKKEIERFKLKVIDLDGKIYEVISDDFGKFNSSMFAPKILDLNDNYLDVLIGLEDFKKAVQC